jgi:putative FmdB family regulatory protein
LPLYAFRCEHCCFEFERLIPLREDHDHLRCPECGEQARRLISTFAVPGGSRTSAPLASPGGG